MNSIKGIWLLIMTAMTMLAAGEKMNSVKDFGAVGDGRVKDTVAVQTAIDNVAKAGGGRVVFPAGTYLCGTIYLRNCITLFLEPGATILGSPDASDYNPDDFCSQNAVFSSERVSGAHLIVGVELHDIAIMGEGVIDGNRQAFYGDEVLDYAPDHFKLKEWRPGQMIFLCECQYVRLNGVRMMNAPYWTCFLHGCDDVTVSDLIIWNDSRTINGDGLDIDCCRRVTVTNCNISTGDDSITLRGSSSRLKDKSRICENVTISNCVLRSRCNAFRIGVGDTTIRCCTLSNIVIHKSRTGICIQSRYSPKSPGTPIEHILFENIYFDTLRPVNLCSDIRGENEREVPVIRDISFRHLRGRGCRSNYIIGNLGRQIKNVSLEDVQFDYYGGEDNAVETDEKHYAEFGILSSFYPIYVKNIEHFSMHNVNISFDGCEHPELWKEKIHISNCPD